MSTLSGSDTFEPTEQATKNPHKVIYQGSDLTKALISFSARTCSIIYPVPTSTITLLRSFSRPGTYNEAVSGTSIESSSSFLTVSVFNSSIASIPLVNLAIALRSWANELVRCRISYKCWFVCFFYGRSEVENQNCVRGSDTHIQKGNKINDESWCSVTFWKNQLIRVHARRWDYEQFQ